MKFDLKTISIIAGIAIGAIVVVKLVKSWLPASLQAYLP